eukprot:TRINITY_DN4852_c0_g1_i3.p1 TRINITY_DN4852_c0_g1~~TRINITY_DN4852_c0_g1_i3.p1  ORF type:complete len:432 (-),score=94.32 TRINITY_DN4852_c0_g1_i3:147-1442(-)
MCIRDRVERKGVAGGQYQVRSDDLNLVERFHGCKMVDVAELPLREKSLWLRHFLEQFMIPAEAEVGPIRLELMRTGMLEYARDRFLALLPAEFCRSFRYRMRRETDFYQDVGGVTREVFMLFTQAVFSSAVGLFVQANCPEIYYTIDARSGSVPETLEFYRFTGRVMGKAFIDGHNIAARFTPPLLKQLLRLPIVPEDLKEMDPQMYSSLEWMLHNPIEGVIDETFAVEIPGSSAGEVVDLIPGGSSKKVTDENKAEYVEVKSLWLLQTSFKDQLQHFCQGFWEVIPQCDKILSVLDVHELDILMSGLHDLDVNEWKQNTQYTGNYDAGSPVVKWFWAAVEKFNAEDKGKLLQFATGSSRIPVEGFKGMQSARGKSCLFTLAVDPTCAVAVPRAHTCFNRIDIPEYKSPKELERYLKMVIETELYGFMMEE